MINLFKVFMSPHASTAVAKVLESGYIGDGPVVQKFEKQLDFFLDHRVACVNSGTSALWLAYDLAGINRGDYVITTPVTCLATNIPLAHLEAIPLWADVDPRTGLIDWNDVARLMKEYPVSAVIAVDYGGADSCTPEAYQLCQRNGAKLIQDSAHSFGIHTSLNADFRCYSFQAIKLLTTGDGGAILCRDPKDHHEAVLKRWFYLDREKGGFRCDQIVSRPGYKFHMTDIAASIGLSNLPHIPSLVHSHRKHSRELSNSGIGSYDPASSCWLHTVHPPDRDRFISSMAQRGIECARTHSRNDVHPIFIRRYHRDLPGVDQYDRTHTEIPNGWWVMEEQIAHIISSVKEVGL